MISKIVLAIDSSEYAARATQWCAKFAASVHADVVVVHADDLRYDFGSSSEMPFLPPVLTGEQRDNLRDTIARDWCKPLADAGVAYRVIVRHGRPAVVVAETAEAEHADLVVCGRRGRGGLTEALLGSTSRELTHHLRRPLVIVP